jgi:RNA polymerase sigma-70 factor (ECF subfamily)
VVHDLPVTEKEVDSDATALAAGFRAGDEDAVRQVYRRHGRAMYSVARSILGDRDAAADAVQQAFLQAWRAAGTYDASRPMGPWLAQITRRVCIDGLRRDSRRPRSAALPERDQAWIDETSSTDRLDVAWMVHEAVDKLSPADRALVRLAYVEGYSFGEVAERLGLPVGTVKSRSARLRNHLSSALAHLAPASDRSPTPARADGTHAPARSTVRKPCREEMSSLR